MSNGPTPLWAKSKRNGKIVTLEEHLLDAEKSARLIFRLDGRWGQNWCRFFRIQGESEQQRFLLNFHPLFPPPLPTFSPECEKL